jgi:single-strand DNA-binding protein
MAWNETKLTVTGWIKSDITTRKTTDGTTAADFLLSANERHFDRETNEWVSGKSLFLRVKCYRKLAERVAATLARGDAVLVTGRAYTARYEADGKPQSSLELEATSIGPDVNLCTVTVERSPVVAVVSEAAA